MKKLARELISRVPELTVQRAGEMAMANAHLNKPYLEKTVADLAEEVSTETGDSAIVVAAGPSLHLNDSISKILESGYEGTIICADGAMGHCLRNGLVPDYVLTLDPHPTRISRWFGDSEIGLVEVEEDDYFRRQDLDPHLRIDEVTRNTELIEIVDRHGPQIKAVVSTSASQRVTKRCIDSGMAIYWWNPLLDDFEAPGSLTAQVFALNNVPCLASGGNAGTASWVIAHAVLGMKRVALVGMDFSYAPGTPLRNTQYYNEIEEIFGDQTEDAFISVRNPHLKQTWYTDPAYYWYRQSFLEMAVLADCETYNCSEGGILFGKGINFIPLMEFLNAN